MVQGSRRTFAQAGMSLVRRFVSDEHGATAVEYALLAGGIGVVIVVGIDAVGLGVNDILVEASGLF